MPSIPWSGDGLTAKLTKEGTIPEETFNKAMVTTVEEALAAADRIGYPVMLKASEGGGGKGIRLSKSAEELKTNFVQVSLIEDKAFCCSGMSFRRFCQCS